MVTISPQDLFIETARTLRRLRPNWTERMKALEEVLDEENEK